MKLVSVQKMWVVVATLAIASAIAVGAPQKGGKGKPPPPDPIEAVILFRNGETAAVTDLSGGIADVFTVDALLNKPSWAPTGDRICFASSIGFVSGEVPWGVFVVDADGQNLQRVTDGGGILTQPVWSPDGRWIAYVRLHPLINDIDLYVVDMDCFDGGGAGCVYHFPTPDFRDFSPTWSPFGDEIATKGISYATGRSEILIYQFDAAGPSLVGSAEILTAGTPLSHDDNSLLQPDWSKETDEWIALAYNHEQLALINRFTKAVVFVTDPCVDCHISAPSWSPCNSGLVVRHLDPDRRKNSTHNTLAFVDLVFDSSGHPTLGNLEFLQRANRNQDYYTEPDWRRDGPCRP